MAEESDIIFHQAVPDLDGLLHRLRRADELRIGMDRQIMAAALLRRLAAAGIFINEAEVAADWLAPVLCTSARDQGAVRARLVAEMRSTEVEISGPTDPVQVRVLARTENAARAVGRRWLVWAGLGCAATILLITWIDAGSPLTIEGGQVNEPGSRWFRQPLPTTWLGGLPGYLAALVFGIMTLLIVKRRHDERVRIAGARPPDELPLLGSNLPWFHEGSLRTSLRSLRQHISRHGRFLNLPQTIRKTVRHAGVPVIVRGGRPKLPEHVILADLNHAEDQMRVPVEALLQCLSEGGVHSEAYAFFGKPHIVHSWANGETESLQRLALRHHGARLLVISDGRAFYDRLADSAADLAPLRDFSERILLIPELTQPWSLAAQALLKAGWFIVEFRSEGIKQLAQWLLSPREYETASEEAVGATDQPPARLDLEPALADGRRVPSARRQELLLDELREWLGEKAFAFLAILAVQSRISPVTTNSIAGHLAMLGVSPPSEDALARLTNLPWMRRGELPNWLRTALVDHIPETLREKARAAWVLHLSGETAPRRFSAATDAIVIADNELVRLRDIALEQMDAADRSDDLMRGMIGENVGLRVMTRMVNDTDWRTVAAAFLGAATVAVTCYFVVTHGTRLADLLLAAAQQIGPIAPRLADVGLLILALLFFSPRIRVLQQVLVGVAAGVAATLALSALGSETFDTIRYLCLAECLIAAAAYRRLTAETPSPLAVRALFSPAHPWANAAVVVALICYPASSYLLPFLAGGNQALLWLGHETAMLAIGALMGLALAVRTMTQGAASWSSLLRAANLYVAGQALAGALYFVFFNSVFPVFQKGGDVTPLWWLIDANARLVGGVAAAFLPFVQPRWRSYASSYFLLPARVELHVQGLPIVSAFIFLAGMGFAVGLPLNAHLSPTIAAVAAGLGLPEAPFRAFLVYVPWLAFAAIGAGQLTSWVFRVKLASAQLGKASLWSAAGVLVVALLFSSLPTIDNPAVSSLFERVSWLLNWLLLWPVARILRSDLVISPRDGLWWRCLLLVLCCVSVLKIGGFIDLAIPVVAWIATRYGARALPAISLALLPMMMSVGADFSVVAIRPGLGWALSGLLVALFITDGKLRASVLAQDRVTTAQIIVLCLLTIELDVGLSRLRFDADLYPLSMTLLAFVGLSRAPVRRLINAFALLELAGILLRWGSLSLGIPSFRFFLGFTAFSGLVNAVLVLAISRLIRMACEAPSKRIGFSELRVQLLRGEIDFPRPIQRFLQWVLELDGTARIILFGLITLDCFAFGISLGDVTLDPFVRYQVPFIALGFGAADRLGLFHRLPFSQFTVRLQRPHSTALTMAAIAAALSVLPTLDISLLPNGIHWNWPFSGILTNFLIAGSFSYIGYALPDLIAARSPAVSPALAVWRSVPVKVGLYAATSCVVVALAIVIVLASPALKNVMFPVPIVTPTPAPTPTPIQATPAQPVATPTPVPNPSQTGNLTNRQVSPPFRCVPTSVPGEFLKFRFNPQTGNYDLDGTRVPASECEFLGERKK